MALLRGINVGRNKRVAMADLRALLESLDYSDVSTYRQSGNALFTNQRGSAPSLERQIASRIEADLGLDVRVLVRAAEEIAALVDRNPFVAEKTDPKELHIAFLSAAPSAKKLASLNRDEFAPDQFELGDRAIYLRQPNGFMASRLPDWERLLGLSVTTRNWHTVTRIASLARERVGK